MLSKIKSVLLYILKLGFIQDAIEKAVIGYLRGKAKKSGNKLTVQLVDALEKALNDEVWKTLLARGKSK
jgi:hypothetical protein